MDGATPFGKKQVIDGRLRVYYYGYWIKAYEVPADTLLAKKRLIEALTRRLFNHVEHGLNVPECGEHLQEALTLGKMVLHRSGEEGLDELWGEPFKAFAFPIEDFYNSRYVKIAQSMQAIDAIRNELIETFASMPAFEGVESLLRDFAHAAREKCETLRTDDDIFDVWTSFVVQAEALAGFRPAMPTDATLAERQHAAEGTQLVIDGRNLISYITRARVPMPKSTREFQERCGSYRLRYAVPRARSVA